eukprot:GHVU01091833.1.p4 GENE.GHVU01091833.1~~GHVU01091833.1.p4  ORF type:complete len:101 (+),score=48.99 GHVU01091833.1:452-754(+)
MHRSVPVPSSLRASSLRGLSVDLAALFGGIFEGPPRLRPVDALRRRCPVAETREPEDEGEESEDNEEGDDEEEEEEDEEEEEEEGEEEGEEEEEEDEEQD